MSRGKPFHGMAGHRCSRRDRGDLGCRVLGEGFADDAARVVLPGVQRPPLHVIKLVPELLAELVLRARGHSAYFPDEPAKLRCVLWNPLGPQHEDPDDKQY